MHHASNAEFLVIFAIAAVAGALVFLHADRNGSKHATAWACFVFLFLGLALPIYVIHVRSSRRAKR
jgi:Flp pilus assembly protein TadB